MVATLRAPIDVQIEITQSCNQKCRHCYNFWRSNGKVIKKGQHFSRSSLQQIINELVLNQVISITITGGEPFIRKDDTFALLSMAKKSGLLASINSNFSLVDDYDIARLANEYDVPILVSLLSSDPDKHALLSGTSKCEYTRVIKSIERAVHYGLPVSINMVLMKENFSDVNDLARLAKELGVKTFCVTKALPNPRNTENDFLLTSKEVLRSLQDLISIEKSLQLPVDVLGCYPKCLLVGSDAYQRFFHRVCVAGKTTITIGSSGEVRPCSHITRSYGNVIEESLEDIWLRMDDWRKDYFLPTLCSNCPISSWCTGGCRVNTLETGFGNMDMHADPEILTGILIDQLNPERFKTKLNDLSGYLVFLHPKVKFREEEFGALVYRSDQWSMIFVNNQASDFLKNLRHGEIFSSDEFLKKSDATCEEEKQTVLNLFNRLISKKILVTSKN